METSQKILIIDDELQIRRFLRIALEANAYAVLEASNGKEGIYKAATDRPEVVVLDLGLPDMDGVKVLESIRQWSAMPVIILSVRDDEKGKIAALEAGADDYVTKPFSVSELIARVHVALRHARPPGEDVQEFKNNGLTVNMVSRTVFAQGREIRLTATEYSLLMQFVRNAGKVLTHRHLMKEIWGPYRTEETQTLRVHMAQLRKKLEADPAVPKMIITEPGVGYRMRLLEDER